MLLSDTYREECSYICSCSYSQAADLPCDCIAVYTPAAEVSVDAKIFLKYLMFLYNSYIIVDNWLRCSHLKLLPEALLDLISGLCQLAELSYPTLDLCGVDAGGVERLQETQDVMRSLTLLYAYFRT